MTFPIFYEIPFWSKKFWENFAGIPYGDKILRFLNRESVATVGTVEQKKLKFFAPLWLREAEPVDNPPAPL